jgi:hypothetical protein
MQAEGRGVGGRMCAVPEVSEPRAVGEEAAPWNG